MGQLNFGIIGCGRIAQRHAEQINNYGKLIAVCDIDEKQAKKLATEYDVSFYQETQALYDNHPEIDLISVCSPNGLHAKHTIEAFTHGYHVLCEKPMAISVQDCGEMIKAAERANKRLFIVKQNRFNPPVAAVKELLDQNYLGHILSLQVNCFWNRNPQYYENSWKGTRDMDGGTLYTQFSHFIDLMYWLAGDVVEVSASIENFLHKNITEIDDTGVVQMRFYNGALGGLNYTVNSYGQNMEGSITLFCEKGSVKIGGQYLNELEYQNIENYSIDNLPKGNPPNQYGQYTGSMSNHGQVYENVVNVLQHGAVISTNAFEGLKTVEIIDKIYRASRFFENIR